MENTSTWYRMRRINKAGMIYPTSFRDVKENPFSVFGHIRQYRLAFGFVIFIGFLNHLVSFLLPLSIGEYFALFFKEETSKGRLLHWMGIQFSSIDQFFLFFCGLLVCKAVFSFIENYETFRQGEMFVKNIREKVFAAQINSPAGVFLQRSYGRYLLRYSNDLKAVQHLLTHGYIEGIRSSIFLVVGLVFMGNINWDLTRLLIVLLSISFVLIVGFTRWQTTRIESSRSQRSSLLAYVARRFARFKRLKLRNDETKTIDVFVEKSDALYTSNMKYNLTESILLTLVPIIILGSVGVLLWRMVFLEGRISAGDGFMLVLILLMMEGGIRRLLKVPGYLNKGKISLDKIEKMTHEVSDPPEVVPAAQSHG